MTAGQVLAQFEILEPLGDGEFGPAYKARDAAAGRAVVVEILPVKGAFDPDRLRQEVKAAAALDHWSIAKVYELASVGEIQFIVREFVAGQTLEQALAAGPLPLGVALACARQIAGALGAGHSIGVTHRHLNLRNIVLTGQDAVKLLNFGLTPVVRDPAFLAPEQQDGRGADARSDVYSLGLVLQRMLGPTAPKPLLQVVARATRKNVARRYQLMEDVRSELDRLAADPSAHAVDRGRRVLLAAGAALLAVVGAGWWILGGRDAVRQGPARLTSDTGLTTEASISPDGRTIAYASDRDAPGVLNLWMQPVSGGKPTRLTDGPDDDHAPAISLDGSRIVFRSERAGGGLYVVPASGGAPQLLVQGGRDPHVSPDGRWIAYWSGDPFSSQGAGVWTIASSGGNPSRIRGEFLDARYPVWSADGTHLLFVGLVEQGREIRNRDWYVAPFANGSSQGRVIRTGAETLLHMQTVRETGEAYYSRAFVIPEAWTSGQILFSGRIAPMGRQSTGQPHLLRIPISPSILEAAGAAHEITSGADWDAHPSVSAGGRLVFSRRESRPEIWSVALDGSGDLRRFTPDIGDARPSVSLDGKRLAYRFHVGDNHDEVRVLDLETGRQVAHVRQDAPRDWPIFLSANGDELVYPSGGIFRMRLPDGKPERISRRGGDQVSSWSADGKHLLVQRGWRGVGLVDAETGREREFLRDDRFPIVEARFAPDGKWVAFTLAARPHSQVFVVPVEAPEQRTEVTADTVSAGSPAWSADGGQLYFLSECQGYRCIWARRLDPHRKAQGEPFPIRHFHHARYALLGGIDAQNVGLVAARDKLVFGMFETIGNVWSLPSLPRP